MPPYSNKYTAVIHEYTLQAVVHKYTLNIYILVILLLVSLFCFAY